ncbi:MAG: hypothetical protein HKN12_04405 [Gemmatimonadetes bacterium]|nr:hypothetical protein [Gemmatimonadota bacterium]
MKKAGLRTMNPLTLEVPYNYWGSDCPSKELFRGDVVFTPWVDETGKRSIENCEASDGD